MTIDDTTTDDTTTTSGLDPARHIWFAGTYMRLVATAADTGGQLAVMEQRARRGFSPPRHVHHAEDTAMLVLEGRITAEVGGEPRPVGPGELVWLPRNVPHTFRVDSDETRLLELATPGGIEQFHVDAGVAAASATIPPPSEPDVARMVSAAEGYDTEIVGPPLT